VSIEIAIIEDQREIREMLAILVNGSAGLTCIKTFERAEEAITEIPIIKPDVVLVDIHLPGISGTECVLQLKAKCPNTQFMMCTSLEDVDTIFGALKAGANGYIIKSTPPAKLLEAIIDIYNGGSPMSGEVARKVVKSFREIEAPSEQRMAILTKREQEVLALLSKGLRYKDVAETLFISLETVRVHIRNIYQKLQVNSSIEAINKAFGKK